jgi:hypothetical protein
MWEKTTMDMEKSYLAACGFIGVDPVPPEKLTNEIMIRAISLMYEMRYYAAENGFTEKSFEICINRKNSVFIIFMKLSDDNSINVKECSAERYFNNEHETGMTLKDYLTCKDLQL